MRVKAKRGETVVVELTQRVGGFEEKFWNEAEGGLRTRRLPDRELKFALEVNLAKLSHYLTRAAHSRSKKTTLGHGAFVVRVVR